MMRATLRCKMTHLDFCMKNDARKETFRQHLEGEYSTETLEFYNAVEDYRNLYESLEEEEVAKMASEMNDMVVHIYTEFVKSGGKKEVNIPGKQRAKISKIIKEHNAQPDATTTLYPEHMFDQAQQEIYQLMNRDTFERFKNNDALMEDMLTSLFDEVDVDHNGSITVKEYKVWAAKNPEVTKFLTDLHNETFMGVSKAAGLEKRKKRRISMAKVAQGEEGEDEDGENGHGSGRSGGGVYRSGRFSSAILSGDFSGSGRHTFAKSDVASAKKVAEGLAE